MIIFDLLFDRLLSTHNKFEDCSPLFIKWIKHETKTANVRRVYMNIWNYWRYCLAYILCLITNDSEQRTDTLSYHNLCTSYICFFFIKFMCWMFLSSNDSYEMDKNMKFNERKRGHDVHDFNSCYDIIE